MIELTRLNGNRLAVNSDLIQFAESAPDTLLTMVTGEKLIVSESLTQVVDRMAAYRARTIAEAARLCPESVALASGAAVCALSSAKAAHEKADKANRDATDEDSANMMRLRRRSGV